MPKTNKKPVIKKNKEYLRERTRKRKELWSQYVAGQDFPAGLRKLYTSIQWRKSLKQRGIDCA